MWITTTEHLENAGVLLQSTCLIHRQNDGVYGTAHLSKPLIFRIITVVTEEKSGGMRCQ